MHFQRYRLGKKKPVAMGDHDGNSGDDEPLPARNNAAGNRAGGGGGAGAAGAKKPPWVGVSEGKDSKDDDDYMAENSFPDVRNNNNRRDPPLPAKILHPPAQRAGGGGGGGNYDETLQQFVQPIYVGDRVRVRNNFHLGAGGQRAQQMRRGSLGSNDNKGIDDMN